MNILISVDNECCFSVLIFQQEVEQVFVTTMATIQNVIKGGDEVDGDISGQWGDYGDSNVGGDVDYDFNDNYDIGGDEMAMLTIIVV